MDVFSSWPADGAVRKQQFHRLSLPISHGSRGSLLGSGGSLCRDPAGLCSDLADRMRGQRGERLRTIIIRDIGLSYYPSLGGCQGRRRSSRTCGQPAAQQKVASRVIHGGSEVTSGCPPSHRVLGLVPGRARSPRRGYEVPLRIWR